jgi:Integrase core domain/HTH-like domain
VHQQLRRDGIRVGRKRVERLMAGQGWQGAFLRRRWRISSTKQDPRHSPAPDLVNRDFTADAPDRLWVADATRIPCGEGVFWMAAVRDAFSNRTVGWKTSDRCDTDLVLSALEYGIWSRDVRDGQLIHHSDRGSTYTAFRTRPPGTPPRPSNPTQLCSRRRQPAPGNQPSEKPGELTDPPTTQQQTRTRHHRRRPRLTLAVPRRATRPADQRHPPRATPQEPRYSARPSALHRPVPTRHRTARRPCLPACSASTSTSPSPGNTPPPETGLPTPPTSAAARPLTTVNRAIRRTHDERRRPGPSLAVCLA